MPYRRARSPLGQRAHTVLALRASWQACNPAGKQGSRRASDLAAEGMGQPFPQAALPRCHVSKGTVHCSGGRVGTEGKDTPMAGLVRPPEPKSRGQEAHKEPQGQRLAPACQSLTLGRLRWTHVSPALAEPPKQPGCGRGAIMWAHPVPLPGTCSQLVPTGISSVIPARTCTCHLLSRAHSIWSLGLEWTLTKVTPAGWKQEGTWVRERGA